MITSGALTVWAVLHFYGTWTLLVLSLIVSHVMYSVRSIFFSVKRITELIVASNFHVKDPLLGGGQLLLRQLETLGGNHLPIYRRPTDPKMPDY